MQDGVDADAGAGNGWCVGEIGLDEVDGCGDVAELAGGEVVETTDVFAASEQSFRKVRADEARGAGDEISCQRV